VNALSLLRGFAENNAWANHRFLTACLQLSDADLRATRTSFFPSIHATLTHVELVDEYYLSALESRGRGRSMFDDEDPFATFAALAAAQRAVDQRLVAFVRDLEGESALDREVHLERADHVQIERTGDVLAHLFQHQIHHRGQAHAMLAGTAIAPPQLDEFFLAAELPLREAELRALGLPVR
jgi:uncharacterized damage-inducible protein DinB